CRSGARRPFHPLPQVGVELGKRRRRALRWLSLVVVGWQGFRGVNGGWVRPPTLVPCAAVPGDRWAAVRLVFLSVHHEGRALCLLRWSAVFGKAGRTPAR